LPFWLQLTGTGITAAWSLHFGGVLSQATWPAVNCHQLYTHTLLTKPIVVKDGKVTTLAGTGQPGWLDGEGKLAQLSGPQGRAVAADGTIYVADTGNHRLRVISPAGIVSTLAGASEPALVDGEASAAAFSEPVALVVEASGSLLVLDRGNKAIRRVTLGGLVSTLAGGVQTVQVDGVGTAAGFRSPSAFAVEPSGALLVSDLVPPALRRVTPDGQVTTLKTGPEAIAIAVTGSRCYVILLNEPRVRVYDLPLKP
jgi:sugar lactone lactonase YvrE